LQTTRTTFLRLITLQLSQSRFTDGLTFIASDWGTGNPPQRIAPPEDKKTQPEEQPSRERF
jgi:hypothetical protein